ncbi:MAG: DNA ligase-associated DEXH box helicase, partial [Alphaproteobacteria bacterium]
LKRVIVDEIHALAESKRGEQLSLLLSRLGTLSPGLRRVGLSATVARPFDLARFLSADAPKIVLADPGPAPDISMLETAAPPPWAGGGGRHAVPEVLELVRRHRTTLIFHNTRAQAELFFHALWMANDEALPIGIHHGALAREQRHRVEAAMAEGALRAVVCTGTLDLGIDWGDVDLVVQIGAPRNVKRLVQRIGRANHRYNAPSRAVIVPANRFEVLECIAALEAAADNDLEGEPTDGGGLDVLCQHILATAAAGPFDADALFAEVQSAGPYRRLDRATFDACLEYVATGGYALGAYDRYQRLMRDGDGRWRLRDPRSARSVRMNLGTIIDTDRLKVRLRGRRGGKPLGEIEEAFAATLSPGDTFLFGGEIVRYEGMREMVVEVSRRPDRAPKIAVYAGTKFATSTTLCARILDICQNPDTRDMPEATRAWLELQKRLSRLPAPDRLLVESFPFNGREHLCLYGFAGRNAMQTLGLLLTRSMEERGKAPLSFVATDYALLVSGLLRVEDVASLLDPAELRRGFDDWLAANAVMKRTFRQVAIIAGLIERNLPGGRRTGRQASFSSDILYETLRRHDPGHLLLRVTRQEALRGLVDYGRIEELLARIGDRVDLVRTDRPTPFAAPLFLEMGWVPIEGQGRERLLADAMDRLMQDAGLDMLPGDLPSGTVPA